MYVYWKFNSNSYHYLEVVNLFCVLFPLGLSLQHHILSQNWSLRLLYHPINEKKSIFFPHRNKLRSFFIYMVWEMHILNDTSILILPCISHIVLTILSQHSMSHIHHFQCFLSASYFVPSCNAGQEIYIFFFWVYFNFRIKCFTFIWYLKTNLWHILKFERESIKKIYIFT